MKAREIKMYDVEKLTTSHDTDVDETLVEAIAASFKHEGLREPIVVVPDEDGKAWIRHGVHRWSAAKAAGWKQIECVVEDAAETEAGHQAMVLVENLIRRHYSGPVRDDKLAELVELRTKNLGKKWSKTKRREKRGRKETARSRARRGVAEELGMTNDSIRAAENRSKRRKAVDTCMDANGYPVPDHIRMLWVHLAESFSEIAKGLRRTEVGIGGLTSTKMDIGRFARYATRWSNQIDGLVTEVKRLKPSVICPECNGMGDECGRCGGIGFLTSYQIETQENGEEV